MLKQHDPLNMDTRGLSIKRFHIKGVQLGQLTAVKTFGKIQ